MTDRPLHPLIRFCGGLMMAMGGVTIVVAGLGLFLLVLAGLWTLWDMPGSRSASFVTAIFPYVLAVGGGLILAGGVLLFGGRALYRARRNVEDGTD